MAPGPDDSRSPCPALNVMANHGYIPRNGLVSVEQMEEALPQTFGLSPDLASFLMLIFLGSKPKGSMLDIGAFPSTLVGETPYQFEQTSMIGDINSQDNPMQQICTKYNAIDGSKYSNQDLFSNGGAVNDELFFRTFGNHSTEYPMGDLNEATKLSMLAMTPNGDGTFTWNKFQNAIPDNWYKRAELDPFSAPMFAADMLEEGAYGCSPNGKNYGGFNMPLLTDGTYTNKELEDPHTNMWCFLSQAAPIVLPVLAKQPMFGGSTSMVKNVNSAVSGFKKGFQGMQCDKSMTSMNLGELGKIMGLNLLGTDGDKKGGVLGSSGNGLLQ